MNEHIAAPTKKRPARLPAVLVLCVVCILINFIGSLIASVLHAPLFLDTIGTILASVFGGYLPGIAVGFISNLVNSVIDSSLPYYGALNVLIAIAAVILVRTGFFDRIWKLFVPIVIFALIGGALSSALTWVLSGMDFGSGVSAPMVQRIYAAGVGPFTSQLIGDFIVDLLDKLIVCLVVFLVLRFLPHRVRDSLKIHGWQQAPLNATALADARSRQARSVSLRTKVLLLLGFATLLVVISAAYVSYIQYYQATIDDHISLGKSIVNLEVGIIDAERVEDYVAEGEAADGYLEAEAQLYNILHSTDSIEYIYVYRILSDGCHVVFDLDTEDLEGAEPGEVVEFDESFGPLLDDLLAGRPIDPIITNDTYGWLLTVYEPIYNAKGDCVCYAAADVSMGRLTLDTTRFIVKVVSLSLGFIIFVLAIGLWLAEYNLILPVNTMAFAAGSFAYTSDADRASSVDRIRELDIRTGDEIENLYHALAKTTEDSMQYITSMQRQSETISKMQNGLILVLADMVESRDQCTGDHVRKTAAYAKLIMEELRREGKFTDILTDSYIEDVVHSAPLHDVGKIQVSDVLLNKPGKLTDEEFLEMQKHTTAGGEIISHAIALVSDAGYLDEAKNLASFHHERWDGRGYPRGLAGEEIPLSARIMAVADVFDALVSRRSYKAPFPFEKAMDIIREESGTHFDPEVAQAFLNASDEVRRIEEAFSREYESDAAEPINM